MGRLARVAAAEVAAWVAAVVGRVARVVVVEAATVDRVAAEIAATAAVAVGGGDPHLRAFYIPSGSLASIFFPPFVPLRANAPRVSRSLFTIFFVSPSLRGYAILYTALKLCFRNFIG